LAHIPYFEIPKQKLTNFDDCKFFFFLFKKNEIDIADITLSTKIRRRSLN